jgi:hypothetical protein
MKMSRQNEKVKKLQFLQSSSITKALNLFIYMRHYAFVTMILNFYRLQAIQILKRTPYILDFMKQLHYVMCMSVTIDRFQIDD